MIRIFTSYLLMLMFIILQWLWLFIPEKTIWAIKEIDPDYIVKARRLSPPIVTDSYNYMYSHEGYFWFKVSDFITKWRHDIVPYMFTLGLFLLFSTLIYRKYLKLYTPNYVFGEVIGFLYYFHTIMLWVFIIVTLIFYGPSNRSIF